MSQPQTRMETFESLKAKLSKNELKYQFVKWERSLPKSFLPAQKRKLVLTVKNALGVDVSGNAPASSSCCESMDGGGDEKNCSDFVIKGKILGIILFISYIHIQTAANFFW